MARAPDRTYPDEESRLRAERLCDERRAADGVSGGQTVDHDLAVKAILDEVEAGLPTQLTVRRVDYVVPVMDELKRRYDEVDANFQGSVFEPVKACREVNRQIRDIEFEFFLLRRDTSPEELLIELYEHGLRPALPEELIAFDTQFPGGPEEYSRGRSIRAVGAETLVNGERHVMCVGYDDRNGRRLGLTSLIWGHPYGALLLVVRR